MAADGADPTQAKREAPQVRRPIRCNLFGGCQGRQATRGGDRLQAVPLEYKRRPGWPTNPTPGAAKKMRRPAISGSDASASSFSTGSCRHRRHHRLKLLDDARFNEYARLIVLNRHVKQLGEHLSFQVSQLAGAVSLFRFQATTARR